MKLEIILYYVEEDMELNYINNIFCVFYFFKLFYYLVTHI
jgi:hypothetical protein